MTATGLCSECQTPTSRHVEGLGWLCRACDPLADHIERRSEAKDSTSREATDGR